jgi:hypothetical protein
MSESKTIPIISAFVRFYFPTPVGLITLEFSRDISYSYSHSTSIIADKSAGNIDFKISANHYFTNAIGARCSISIIIV